MEYYYSAVKTNEILPFAAMWMDLENIMLSEISQDRGVCLAHSFSYVSVLGILAALSC